MHPVSLGYSPCPNDTFLFYPLVHGLIDTGRYRFVERLEDVETLNCLALEGAADITKVSYHAYGHIRDNYVLLRSGGAMGMGCGPLVVSRNRLTMADLKGKKIAVPGRHTTALLLLRLFDPALDTVCCLPYHEIMDAVAQGIVDAGVVIHESRFTYASQGLYRVLDLGDWWYAKTGLPLPLGGIAARLSLGPDALTELNGIVRSSIAYALSHPDESVRYVRSHSREMSDEVCAAHINLYVNEYSLDPGRTGEAAAQVLLAMGEELGLFPPSGNPPFISQ
jgi:1,4-dihydroxy-6-naphthoate synthase